MDVIDDTTLEVTNEALDFHWPGYGLSLYFPQNSLPVDCQRCVVEIKASLSGEYRLPEGYELVSGVYWIYCLSKFSKPVVLKLQYDGTDAERLGFVRAECTQKRLPYTFRDVQNGDFSEGSSYASISVSRFSGWSVRDKIRPRRYTAQVHYSSCVGLNKWKVIFVITCKRNLDLDHLVCAYKIAYMHRVTFLLRIICVVYPIFYATKQKFKPLKICIIGASLSEPHIVVISITFSCTSVGTTSVVDHVNPIAYNRISTWKTGILHARAG